MCRLSLFSSSLPTSNTLDLYWAVSSAKSQARRRRSQMLFSVDSTHHVFNFGAHCAAPLDRCSSLSEWRRRIINISSSQTTNILKPCMHALFMHASALINTIWVEAKLSRGMKQWFYACLQPVLYVFRHFLPVPVFSVFTLIETFLVTFYKFLFVFLFCYFYFFCFLDKCYILLYKTSGWN